MVALPLVIVFIKYPCIVCLSVMVFTTISLFEAFRPLTFHFIGMARYIVGFYRSAVKYKLLTKTDHLHKGGGCLACLPLEVHPEVELYQWFPSVAVRSHASTRF